MPIPKPKDDETKNDFMSRCMDDEVMKTEYDDQDQRYAVCLSMWEEKNREVTTMIERRFITVGPMELREDDGEQAKIVGYSARFDELSEDLGGFREKIRPGAFAKSIKRDDIRALFNHDSNYVLGRSSAGTLKLKEDRNGLLMENTPPDTQWAKDLMVSIKRGDITHQSFGFNVLVDEWDESNKSKVVRTLKEVRLFDVGPVTFPAYPQTDVQARSAAQALGVDFADISRVLIKAAHSLTISDEERQLVQDVMRKMAEIVPHGAGADGSVDRSSMDRRKREIMLKRLGIRNRNH